MEIYKSSEITVHRLNELREEDKKIQILDVRDDTERDHAHVKDTIHIKLSEIAKRVGISKTPCWNRIRKMEEDKIITSKVALLNNVKINLSIRS